MKHVFVTVLALLLAMSAAAESNPTDAFTGRWRDAENPGAEMKILPEYQEEEGADELALYPIDFTWNPTGDRPVVWTMTARYNGKKQRLEYVDGTKIEDGRIMFSGTKGYLKLNGEGKLVWMDSRESASLKLAFAREYAPAPTAEEFADGYFRVVAGLERGSAGAALKAAKTIAQVLQFAEARELWNADGEAMQRNLEAGWEMLTPDEQARFDAAFDSGVSDPADEAFEDFGALRMVFKDAGVGDEMARLTSSPEVRLSWEFLSSATLNMGNLDDGVYEDALG